MSAAGMTAGATFRGLTPAVAFVAAFGLDTHVDRLERRAVLEQVENEQR